MRLIDIQNERGIKKDSRSGAIVSTDETGLRSYLERRSAMEQKDAEIQELKAELKDIKEMLNKLLSINTKY